MIDAPHYHESESHWKNGHDYFVAIDGNNSRARFLTDGEVTIETCVNEDHWDIYQEWAANVALDVEEYGILSSETAFDMLMNDAPEEF